MFKKSFFNPFSTPLLALAALAFFVDVAPQTQGEVDAFAPVVLFLMWLVGGFVRLFYEKETRRSFDRHMSTTSHATVWKKAAHLHEGPHDCDAYANSRVAPKHAR